MQIFGNNATALTALPVGKDGVIISISSLAGQKFPRPASAEWFMATLEAEDGAFEVVRVTNNASGNMTVVRAQEASAAQAFSVGTRFAHRNTAGSMERFLQRTGDVVYGGEF